MPPTESYPEEIIGQAPAMQALLAQLQHLASFDTVGHPAVPTLLLQGETGTGKGLVARCIHRQGPRAAGPFLQVNCAAIPDTMLEAELFGFEAGAFTDAKRPKPGLFEAASGGMLFLDEIDALPLSLQAKLLDAIETKRVRRLGAVTAHQVDVKLIAATKADLPESVAAGHFRDDLYQRLTVIILTLPPLRERGSDSVLLARYFLQRYATAYGLGAKRLHATAEQWLQTYRWPGNVRELSHLIERVALLHQGEDITADDLRQLCRPIVAAVPPSAPPAADSATSEDEPARMRQALLYTGGNVARAARVLGLTRSAMRYRMQRYGMQRPKGEPAPGLPAPEPGRDGQPAPSPAALAPHPAPHTLSGLWEQKPVVVLLLTTSWPSLAGDAMTRWDPWTVVRHWEGQLTEKVHGFGGTVLDQTPSFSTIAFGLPLALERMAQRAVQAALAVRHLALETGRETGANSLPVIRQAIHLGTVLCQTTAQAAASQVLAIDETLAYPLRMVGYAQPGDILVSATVARQIEPRYDLRAAMPASGRSHTEPPEAYKVVKVRTRHAPWVRQVGPALSQFIGRQAELGLLTDRLARMEAGQGQVVGLLGEAGIGKSRFVYEFRQRLMGRPFTYLAGSCYAYSTTTPYLPVLDIVRRNCGIADTDSPEAVTTKVHRSLLDLDMPPETWGPYLLYLLGVPAAPERLRDLTPWTLKARIFETLWQMSRRGSQRRPLIFEIEDVHWIDATSEEFLAALVERLVDTRILLLLTYRPGYQPAWLDKPATTQLTLSRLSARESRRLLDSVWPPTQASARLVELVLAKADGNPLFLEELSRAVLEQGESPTLGVPDTIQAVLAARMDRLSTDARQLLQTAAVIGKDVSWRLLQAVTVMPAPALTQQLTHLQEADFLHEGSFYPELVYTFKHVLIQEVAYQMVPDRLRRQHHQRIAEVLCARFADLVDSQPERVAHHYTAAGCPEQAMVYWQRAGRRAYERSAHVEAISHLTKGIALLATCPPSPDALHQELRLQTTMGAACMAVKGYAAPEVEQAYARARDLCQQLGDARQLFPILIGLWNFYFVRGDLQAALDFAERLHEMATQAHDPVRQLRAHTAVGVTFVHLSQPTRARTHLEQGRAFHPVQTQRSLSAQSSTVACLAYSAWTLAHLGYLDQAGAWCAQAISLAQSLAHPLSLATAWGLACCAEQFGQAARRALESAEHAIRLSREHGFPFWEATGMIIGGWATAIQGQGGKGLELIHRGVAIFRATGARVQLPYWLGLLADVHRHAGQPDAGLQVLEEALEILQQTDERYYEAELYRLQGELGRMTAGGSRRAAWSPESCFQHALAVARRQQAKLWELRAATSLARLWQAEGNRQAAYDLLASVYEWFTEGFDTAGMQEAKMLLEELA